MQIEKVYEWLCSLSILVVVTAVSKTSRAFPLHYNPFVWTRFPCWLVFLLAFPAFFLCMGRGMGCVNESKSKSGVCSAILLMKRKRVEYKCELWKRDVVSTSARPYVVLDSVCHNSPSQSYNWVRYPRALSMSKYAVYTLPLHSATQTLPP